MFHRQPDLLRDLVARAESYGIDHLVVGDHVSFKGGAGSDGLMTSMALLMLSGTLSVHTSVYLLPLRHPVPVARQLSTLSELAPGRFTFGVGVAGEDRDEVKVCGVDPATRGRRTDECLTVLRGLLSGQTTNFSGEFFELRDAVIHPVPQPPLPIVIGGRSAAALRRAGRAGDGWLGLFVSAKRYAEAVSEVAEHAALAGRGDVEWQHGLSAWCGFGHSREDARPHLAAALEAFYKVPFEKFERYTPYGTAVDVAEALAPYVEAGCRSVNVIPIGTHPERSVEDVADTRRLLLEAVG